MSIISIYSFTWSEAKRGLKREVWVWLIRDDFSDGERWSSVIIQIFNQVGNEQVFCIHVSQIPSLPTPRLTFCILPQ